MRSVFYSYTLRYSAIPRALLLTLFLLLLIPAVFADDGEISFLVLGDWGRDGEYHQSDVASTMGIVADSMGADFVISTGDNFYSNGVSSVDDSQWMSSFEMVYTAPSLNIPWYAVLGNHDYRGNWKAQIDYSETSSRWRMPAPYYTVKYQLGDSTSVQLFFLDTNPFPLCYNLNPLTWRLWFKGTKKQMRWFEESLAASDAVWKIVVAHHGLYSTGARHGNTGSLKKKVEPLLEKYGVQAYFNGHDHSLQHQDPERNHVQFFTSGAGSDLHDMDEDTGETRFAQSIQGFMAARLTPDTLHIQIIDYQGNLLYSTAVGRDGNVMENQH